MQNLNKIELIGNVGQEPELKYTGGGTAVLRIRLATNVAVPTKEDPKRERTDWHTAVVFGKRAEGLAKFLKKGCGIFVSGRLEIDTYEKEGQKKLSVQVVVNDLLFLTTPVGKAAEVPEGDNDFSDEEAAAQ